MIGMVEVALLILSGFVGTLIAIALGWSESQEPFDAKKFISSLMRGTLGIVIYIIGAYAMLPQITIWDYLAVALFAAGFDAVIKRGQGAIAVIKRGQGAITK